MNQIQKSIYPFARRYLLQYFTNHLGTVVEHEDKIICYIYPHLFNKQDFDCTGIIEKEEKIANFFGLNKPIYYVFQNIKFTIIPNIVGYLDKNINVLIKNCEFPYGLTLIGFDKCVIKDSKIYPSGNFWISTKKLSMKNVTIQNPFEFLSSKYNIPICAEDITMKSSHIGKENEDKLNVSISATEKSIFSDSQIYGKKIELFCPHLNLHNSFLQETENIQIHTNKLVYSKKKRL